MMRCTLAVTAMLLAAPLFAQDDQSERLLLPIFTPPVAGAFGSEFHTSVTIANPSDTVLSLSGLEYDCNVILSCPQTPDRIDMAPERVLTSEALVPNGAPGRFVFVPKGDLDRLSMSLRIHDVTREDLNFGTEMPIVRESEFVTGRIVFPLVPVFPWYRNTLRIYAASPVDVMVKAGAQPAVRISLTGAVDPFDPAYAVFTNFKGVGLARVTVQAVDQHDVTPVPIWAFITVTNNQTQAITTITTRP
jgi:hypothetical protein